MTSTIVSLAAELFSEEEEKKSSTTPYSMNQRAVKIHYKGNALAWPS